MSTRKIYVVNDSTHDFKLVDQFGTSINDIKYKWDRGTKVIDDNYSVLILAGYTTEIGWIEEPNMWLRSNGNWGWWNIQDSTNHAMFELFAYCHPTGDEGYYALCGLKAKCDYEELDADGLPKNPIPNPIHEYLECDSSNESFTFTIKSAWTDRSPKYVFNFGHYAIKYELLETGIDTYATHAYVVVHKFDGPEDPYIRFQCWGAAHTGPHGDNPDVHYPALTFLGGEYELALARTISCFDPNEIRSDYDRHPSSELTRFVAAGKLGLGDCSGIVYGETGVCHQMANRICKAVTDLDVGDRADMTLYNLTHTAYGQYGGKPDKTTPSWITDQIERKFDDFITVEEFEKFKEKFEDQKEEDTDYLFKPWDEYFAECKRLVAEAGYIMAPLVALRVRHGDVIDAITPIFAETTPEFCVKDSVVGKRYGGVGGRESLLEEKEGYVITGINIYRGQYFGREVIAQIQVIWHKLTRSGIDSSNRIVSRKLGSGNFVETLQLEELRLEPGTYITALDATVSPRSDGTDFLKDVRICQKELPSKAWWPWSSQKQRTITGDLVPA